MLVGRRSHVIILRKNKQGTTFRGTLAKAVYKNEGFVPIIEYIKLKRKHTRIFERLYGFPLMIFEA